MRLPWLWMLLLTAGLTIAAEDARVVERHSDLPVAPDPNFEFRKVKIFTMDNEAPHQKGGKGPNLQDLNRRGNLSHSRAVTQEASLNFERSYRLFGAVTAADQRQRFGEYFDFFWRARRPADVKIRFEYKQEKLRAFTQAKEIAYQNVRGTNHTAFQVIGDEYFDDGKVLAWRCLLIEHGRIVAEKRSFLWDRSG